MSRSRFIGLGLTVCLVAVVAVYLVTRPSPTAQESDWRRVPLDSSLFGDGASMNDITVGGPGFVAVGGNGEELAAVWSSIDGSNWVRAPHEDALDGPGYQTMNAVVAGGPGLVAVGVDGTDLGSVAAVWTSVDGAEWARVPNDESVFGASGVEPPLVSMLDVVAGGPGLVAIGEEISDLGWVAAVWTSTDGLFWTRVPHDEAVFGGPSVNHMRSVTVGGPGLVAVGEEEEAGWVVWTSVDGLSWTKESRGESTPGGPNEYMYSVTAGAPGLVAVGADWSGSDDAEPAVWTSADGVTWSRAPLDDGLSGGQMSAVAAGGPGLVAVGGDYSRGRSNSDGPIPDAAIWTSVDGLAWSRVPHSDDLFAGGLMTAVATMEPQVLVLGLDQQGSGSSVLWMMTFQEGFASSTTAVS